MILDENLFAEYYDEDKLKLPFRVYMDGTEYTLNEEEIGWIFDDLSAVDVSPKDIVKYEGVGDADYFKLTFKDGSQKAWYIHSGMYIPDEDLDESLKEDWRSEPVWGTIYYYQDNKKKILDHADFDSGKDLYNELKDFYADPHYKDCECVVGGKGWSCSLKDFLNEYESTNESLKESYAVVRYWDNKGYLKNKIVNGSSSEDVEKKVSKLIDKYDVYDIDIASKDVADSEYFKNAGLKVHRIDLLDTRFDKKDMWVNESLKEDLAAYIQKLHDEDEYLWNLHDTDYTWLYDELDKYSDDWRESDSKYSIADVIRMMPKEKQREIYDRLVEPYTNESLKEGKIADNNMDRLDKNSIFTYLNKHLINGVKVADIDTNRGRGFKSFIVYLTPDKYNNDGYGYAFDYIPKSSGSPRNFISYMNDTLNDNIKDINESLNEDFDEVVAIEVPDVNVEIEAEETKPEGPAPGADTGITDLLLSLINDENSTIQTYNSFKASLEDHADFDDVINDIVAEEYNHVGMLQTLLRKISPNSVTIDAGEEEAKDLLDVHDDNSLMFDEITGEIDDSFDNGFGGIFA